MIQNDSQLEGTREALRQLEAAMLALKHDRPRLHTDRYALMASPVLEDLRRLRHEIDVYLGVDEAIRAIIPLGLGLSPDGEKENVQAEGTLREIDLDQGTFILRNIDGSDEIHCCIGPGYGELLEIAKAGLDHRVTATGIRHRDPTRRQPIQVLTIDILAPRPQHPPFQFP